MYGTVTGSTSSSLANTALPSGLWPVTTRLTRMAGLYAGASDGSGGDRRSAVAALVPVTPPEPVGHPERGGELGPGSGMDRLGRGVEEPGDHRARLAQGRAAAQEA